MRVDEPGVAEEPHKRIAVTVDVPDDEGRHLARPDDADRSSASCPVHQGEHHAGHRRILRGGLGYPDAMSNWNASWTRNIWRPEEPRLLIRRTDGFGWSINVAHLLRRTHKPA